MCQAYEGEAAYLRASDKACRLRGYNAYKAGVSLADNPEADHSLKEYSRKYQWELGWLTAENGREPW